MEFDAVIFEFMGYKIYIIWVYIVIVGVLYTKDPDNKQT